MARRHRSKSRSPLGGGMNKWIKIGAFAVGAAVIAPMILGNRVPQNLAGAAGGFVAGGPVGAVAGYLVAPMIANKITPTGTASSAALY